MAHPVSIIQQTGHLGHRMLIDAAIPPGRRPRRELPGEEMLRVSGFMVMSREERRESC